MGTTIARAATSASGIAGGTPNVYRRTVSSLHPACKHEGIDRRAGSSSSAAPFTTLFTVARKGHEPATTTATTATRETTATTGTSTNTATSGSGYKASFSSYTGCSSQTACQYHASSGNQAGISENFYGSGSACGTCWKLTVETDDHGNAIPGIAAGNSIVVKVTDLCPAVSSSGVTNPLCAQSGTSGTNTYGANVNFDLCQDSGTAKALMGDSYSTIGVGIGTAVEVDCSEWTGTM